MTRLTPIGEILPTVVDDLLQHDDAARERVKAALVDCKRLHKKECRNPVEMLKTSEVSMERAALMDAWARYWREALALGLTPEPLAHGATDAEVIRRGKALRAQVIEAREHEAHRDLLDEFEPRDQGRVANWFYEAKGRSTSKGWSMTPEQLVKRVVDIVNARLRSWKGGDEHYDADHHLVRVLHEKRELALRYAERALADEWEPEGQTNG